MWAGVALSPTHTLTLALSLSLSLSYVLTLSYTRSPTRSFSHSPASERCLKAGEGRHAVNGPLKTPQGTLSARWSTTRSPKVNLPHAINFRVQIWSRDTPESGPNETFVLHRVGHLRRLQTGGNPPSNLGGKGIRLKPFW